MCQKCYEFFDIVDAVRSVSINESITLAPVVFKWNQVKCYEQKVLEKPQSGRKRTRSVTTTTEYGWNDECANKCFTLLSALKMKNNEEDNESPDRDELIYSPGCITPKLEAAYLRFCRFSRTLAIRNFEEYITSVDVKDLCGDLLVTDALIILKQFNYNVVDAVYYLQSNDLRHAWADGRLDKEKRRIFENYVSQYGFNSSITKVIGFENKRRDVSSKEINRGSYTYLFNYYQSWKRTHDGSNIMEKFYRSGQKVIENVTGKEICTESKFKDIPILCQYCEKDEFRVGKTNKIMCKKCYEFFNIVDAVRSVSINESITLAPIVFKWNRVECYEPFVPRKLRKYRKRRTRSVTTSNEYFLE
uniref:Uncharacterized protein n=1 Tax=Panagrolaimus superbus TaxID=310955 RepID=A0A914Z560_9BILA